MSVPGMSRSLSFPRAEAALDRVLSGRWVPQVVVLYALTRVSA